jgi:hypothetical protein
MTVQYGRRLLAGALISAAAATVAPAQAAKVARPSITKIAVSNTQVTVRGRVKLPVNSAAVRRRTRVLVSLEDGAGKAERFKRARIGRRGAFRVSRRTALSGALTLHVQVFIGGRKSGRALARSVQVSAEPGGGTTPGGGSPGSGPNAGNALVGAFKLDRGAAPSNGSPSGSWFEMLTPTGVALANFSSPGDNKDYTPLSPGSDGGLRTDVYQPAPSPAFSGGTSGDALAGRIIKPVPFYNVNFAIVTEPTDPQAGLPDPLPAIAQRNGKLSGQVTAWAAQWNGQSFNQGTPKPDGSTPSPTTPLSGTYNSATRRFVLTWKSLIVGGQFNGFTGYWHLEGTFVPAS